MKRYVRAMGVKSPAEIIPNHPAYHPTLQIKEFTRLINIADSSNNASLLNGLIQAVINDINSDNNAGNVPNIQIRNYYRSYYDAAVKLNSNIMNANLLNNLSQLV